MSFLERNQMSEPLHKAMRMMWNSPLSGPMYAVIDLMWQDNIRFENGNAEWGSWLDQVHRVTKDCKTYQEAALCAKRNKFRVNLGSHCSIILFGLTDLMTLDDWETLLCYCQMHQEQISHES